MSLIIIKVDREHNTHSIYSEGLECSGTSVIDNFAPKIKHVSDCDVSMLIGTAGDSFFGDYVRLYISKYLTIFKTVAKNDYSEEIQAIIQNVFNELLNDYTKYRKKKENINFGCVMSVNGKLFTVDSYDNNYFYVKFENSDYAVNGSQTVAAKCLLDLNIPINTVFNTISKYEIYLNNNVNAIEHIQYNKI